MALKGITDRNGAFLWTKGKNNLSGQKHQHLPQGQNDLSQLTLTLSASYSALVVSVVPFFF